MTYKNIRVTDNFQNITVEIAIEIKIQLRCNTGNGQK